ncbi:MAG: hypothetical protein K0Q49_213 [Haloplasmataceae bacterium]|nr:hypothetical protein [Haloplasmataceae bacterium]
MTKKILGLFLTIALLFVVSACGTNKVQELLDTAKEELAIVYSSGDSNTSVTKKVTLITTGKNSVVITWSSSDTSVITNDGSVIRPVNGSGDKEVTLTATLMLEELTATKTFTLTVKELAKTDSEKLNEAKTSLAIIFATDENKDSVKSNITLPTTEGNAAVVWSSSILETVSATGVVTRPGFGAGDATVVLTATLTVGSETTIKQFVLKVLALETMLDSDAVAETKGKIIILSGNTETFADFELPTAGSTGTTIAWVSSNSDLIQITEEVMGNGIKAVVTRPASGEGDEVVTLTATITKGTVTDTRTFEVTVLEAEPLLGGTVADVLALPKETKIVLNNVVVFGVTNEGYYVYDGTGFMFIFTSSQPVNVIVGDKISVKGNYTLYYTQPEIEAPYDYTVISSGNPLPQPEVKTVANIINADANVKTLYSAYLTVEGTVLVEGTREDVFIQDDAGNKIDINYKSQASVLKAFVGKKVSVDLAVHTKRSDTGLWRLSFFGTAADVQEIVLTDAEKVEAAKSFANLPIETDGNLSLPTVTVSGVNILWTSSHPDIIATDGTVVLPLAETDVTLTATFSLNDATATRTFTVKVLTTVIPGFTVAQALDVVDGTEVKVEAIVVANSGYGYVVYSGGEFGFVYTNAVGTAVVGDNIVFTAKMGSFNGLRQLQNPKVIQTKSSGNTLPEFPVGTITELMTRVKTAATVTATVTVEGSGSFVNVFLTDDLGNKVQVYYKSTPTYETTAGLVLKNYEGLTVTLPVIMYQDGKDGKPGTVLFVGTDSGIEYVSGTRPLKTIINANDAPDGAMLRVEGLVIANSNYGYIIYGDGEYGFVYTNAVGTATVGDLLVLEVTIGSYKNLKQLTNPTIVETTSIGNTLPVLPVASIEELTTRVKTGALVTVTVSIEGTNNNVFLTDYYGKKVQVYYKSTPDYLTTAGAVLKAHVGKTITLPVFMYQDGLVLFVGTDNDITVVTDAEKFALVKEKLTLSDETIENLILPTTVFGVTVTWATDNAAVLSEAGVVVRPVIGQPDVTVNLTATLTSGTLTETKTFVVVVKAEVEEGAFTDLIISQYAEGSSFNKAIELYNGTSATVNLSEYTLEYYSNGVSTPTKVLSLSGTINAGETYLMVNAQANAEYLGLADFIDDLIDSKINHNGDDVYLLKHNGTTIDSFGKLGEDPGAAWVSGTVSTLDMNLVRKPNITSGDIIVDDVFDPSVEWIPFPKDSSTDFGTHTIN